MIIGQKKKAEERGITQEEILKEWKDKSEYSCEKGTLFHEYAENYLNNKIFPYPEEKGKKEYWVIMMLKKITINF